jgi:hypothetical protein
MSTRTTSSKEVAIDNDKRIEDLKTRIEGLENELGSIVRNNNKAKYDSLNLKITGKRTELSKLIGKGMKLETTKEQPLAKEVQAKKAKTEVSKASSKGDNSGKGHSGRR